MEQKDKKEFMQMLEATYELYQKEFNINILHFWWAALADLTLSEVRTAFNAHARDTDKGMFLPLPADIRRHCNGRSIDNAVTAWTKVEKAIKHSGSYYDVVFDDPLIHICIDKMGGWVKLSMTKSDQDLVFVAKEFKDTYRSLHGTPAAYEPPPALYGTMNQELQSDKRAKLLPPRAYGNSKEGVQSVVAQLSHSKSSEIKGMPILGAAEQVKSLTGKLLVKEEE